MGPPEDICWWIALGDTRRRVSAVRASKRPSQDSTTAGRAPLGRSCGRDVILWCCFVSPFGPSAVGL
jgi:hypothetical protein